MKMKIRNFEGSSCAVCRKSFRDGTQSRRNMTAVRIETNWAHYHGYVCSLCVDLLAANQITRMGPSSSGATSRLSPKQTPTTAFGKSMTIAKAKSILIEAATTATASGELRQAKGELWA